MCGNSQFLLRNPFAVLAIGLKDICNMNLDVNHLAKMVKAKVGWKLHEKAAAAYGWDFVKKSEQVSANLGIPREWLLAAICWETTQFQAIGPPWPLNKGDGGGGLIGFTPLKGHPAETMTPVQQLDLVEQHYRKWMTALKITAFKSPEDLYLIVRGPGGIGQPDSYYMGAGINKGQVLKIYREFLQREAVNYIRIAVW
jgi:hypothetical protein